MPCAAALVDADDRASRCFMARSRHLDDLLAVDLTEAAAEDRDVLGEDAHRAAVDVP
jgi:hypothetical protein